MISRRDLLSASASAYVARHPLLSGLFGGAPGAVRCINVVNFIREIEPRFPMDMMLPVRSQMAILKAQGLPATWLLQFDALVSGPFVPFLKSEMPEEHEVGFWFEMNEKHCRAAGVEWRGRPGYEWDHVPHVAFTIGYTPEERIKLADTAMAEFRRVWGRYPKSVASWNLDAITMAHLTGQYGIDAYAVCRDQIATDGFTIWGAPFGGYYPSRTNCWSPALSRSEQIGTPVFRMLGQDPVYYYDNEFPLPSGRVVREPDTLEPAWTAGRTPEFVEGYFRMIEDAPAGRFAYAQMGQENTFPWDQQQAAYEPQMKALAILRKAAKVHVETMGESGRRFKKAFRETPTQAQVWLDDPFGNTNPAEGSIWYASRFYRADLHLRGGLPYLRDLTVYSDRFPQPFLREATRLTEVEQKMPAALDGYHWGRRDLSRGEPRAGGFFEAEGQRLTLAGKPKIREEGSALVVELPLDGGRRLTVRFEERRLRLRLSSGTLGVSFEWDPAKATLTNVESNGAHFRQARFEYAVAVTGGGAAKTDHGWRATAQSEELLFDLSQTS